MTIKTADKILTVMIYVCWTIAGVSLAWLLLTAQWGRALHVAATLVLGVAVNLLAVVVYRLGRMLGERYRRARQ